MILMASVALMGTTAVLAGTLWWTLAQSPDVLPVSILIHASEWNHAGAKRELTRRINLGAIPDRNVADAIRITLPEPGVELVTPYPMKTRQIARVVLGGSLGDPRWSRSVDRIALVVNNETLPNVVWARDGNLYDRIPAFATLIVPPLPGGDHEIRINGDVVVSDSRSGNEVLRKPFQIRNDIRIEKPLKEYLSVTEKRSQSELVGQNFVAGINYDKDSVDCKNQLIIVELGAADERIVASIWVRPRGEDFLCVGDFISRSRPGRRSAKSHHFCMGGIDLRERAGPFEVKLVPNPAEAMRKKHKECYGGVISWSSLKVRKGPSNFALANINFVPPTRAGKVKLPPASPGAAP